MACMEIFKTKYWRSSALILALAGGQAAGEVQVPEVEKASISGKIVDRESSRPLVGAVIRLGPVGAQRYGATTNGAGAFFLAGLAPGPHRLSIGLIGYHALIHTVSLQPGDRLEVEVALLSKPIELSSVEIIGETDRVNRGIGGTVSKLSAATVEKIRPVGTQELLELIPGINGYADDGMGNSRLSIGIRGLNPRRSSRVLLLEDGVPIQPAVYVYPNAYYNPPAERIHAVEVVKSSASIRHGPQTMGGVVNYITRRPDGSKGVVNQVTVGNNGYYSLFAEWRGLGAGPAQSDAQLLYKHGNGFRDNNSFDQLNGTLKTQIHLGKDKVLYLKANGNFENSMATYTGLTEYSYRTNPNFNPKEDDNFKVLRTSLDLIYSSRITPNLGANTTVYISFFDRRWWRENDIFARPASLRSGVLEPAPYFQSGDLVRTGGGESNFGILRTFYVGGLEQTYTLKHGLGEQSAEAEVGARVHWERFIDDKKIGDRPDARDGVYYTGTPGDPEDPVAVVGQSHHYETAALALYARERFHWGSLSLNPGLRFEVFEQERVDRMRGSVLADKVSAVLLPGVGVNYPVGRINLFAGVHRGYTAPSSGALKITNFGQDVASGGLDLKAEKSWNLEAGLRRWGPMVRMEGAVFLVDIKDLVAAGRGTAFKNLGGARTRGLELGLAWWASRWLAALPDIHLAYTFLQTEITSGRIASALSAGHIEADIAGRQLPYAPRHTLNAGMARRFGQSLQLRCDLRWVDRVFTDFENIEETFNRGDTGPIPSYGLVNAGFDYAIGRRWTAFASAKNLLDQVYIGSRLHSNPGQPRANLSSGILIGPRRQVNVGVRRGL